MYSSYLFARIYWILLTCVYLIYWAFSLFFLCCSSRISLSFRSFFLDIYLTIFLWFSLKLLISFLVCSRLLRSRSRMILTCDVRLLCYLVLYSAFWTLLISKKVLLTVTLNVLACFQSVWLMNWRSFESFYFLPHPFWVESGYEPASRRQTFQYHQF